MNHAWNIGQALIILVLTNAGCGTEVVESENPKVILSRVLGVDVHHTGDILDSRVVNEPLQPSWIAIAAQVDGNVIEQIPEWVQVTYLEGATKRATLVGTVDHGPPRYFIKHLRMLDYVTESYEYGAIEHLDLYKITVLLQVTPDRTRLYGGTPPRSATSYMLIDRHKGDRSIVLVSPDPELIFSEPAEPGR